LIALVTLDASPGGASSLLVSTAPVAPEGDDTRRDLPASNANEQELKLNMTLVAPAAGAGDGNRGAKFVGPG